MDAAVTAAKIAASNGIGAIYAPLAMGGPAGLRVSGLPLEQLARWLEGMKNAALTAMRYLDGIEAWNVRAESVMAQLSGRTPVALHCTLSTLSTLTEWPSASAVMVEGLAGASHAAVQRNLVWMQERGPICEVTEKVRFKIWLIPK